MWTTKLGAYKAVSHLIGLGHRRIGFISNAPLSYAEREGPLCWLQAGPGGSRYFPMIPIWFEPPLFYPRPDAQRWSSCWTLPERPTAVFCASDVVALGALGAIHGAGFCIPDDVAVVGFDDISLAAHAHPPLTTVRVPAYGLGWTAAEVLIARIEGDAVSSVTLDTELVIRESCGARSAAEA